MFARPLPQPRGAASSRVSSKFCLHQKKTYFNSSIQSSRRHHKSSCVKSRIVDNSLFSSALFCLLSVKIWSRPVGCALQTNDDDTFSHDDCEASSRLLTHSVLQSFCITCSDNVIKPPPRRSYKNYISYTCYRLKRGSEKRRAVTNKGCCCMKRLLVSRRGGCDEKSLHAPHSSHSLVESVPPSWRLSHGNH